MLVLSRIRGESIVISDNVTVTIVEISGNKVRLGFTAPTEVRIDRAETVSKERRERMTGEVAAHLERIGG